MIRQEDTNRSQIDLSCRGQILPNVHRPTTLISLLSIVTLLIQACGITDSDSERNTEPELSDFPLAEMTNDDIPLALFIGTGDIYTDADEPDFGTAVSIQYIEKNSNKADGSYSTPGMLAVTVNGNTVFTDFEEFCLESTCYADDYAILDEIVQFDETVDVEITFDGNMYSHTLTMPYTPQLNLPDSFREGGESTIGWSIQSSPPVFWLQFFYDIYIEDDRTGYNYSPPMAGSERSYTAPAEIVAETIAGDRWVVDVVAADYEYWSDNGILMAAVTSDSFEHEE